MTPQYPPADGQQAGLERDARTARIFAEALARRARKIARGEPVSPPFELSPGDAELTGAVTYGT